MAVYISCIKTMYWRYVSYRIWLGHTSLLPIRSYYIPEALRNLFVVRRSLMEKWNFVGVCNSFGEMVFQHVLFTHTSCRQDVFIVHWVFTECRECCEWCSRTPCAFHNAKCSTSQLLKKASYAPGIQTKNHWKTTGKHAHGMAVKIAQCSRLA